MIMKLEVCVDSYTSLLTAVNAGADRIELCSALNLGGLTPCYGLMKQAKTVKGIEIVVMIRPRSGDFLYDNHEFETMKNDIRLAKEMEFDGIVTGVLLKDGKIDMERMKELVTCAHPLPVVFHRAFDQAKDPFEDVKQLIDMGIVRILTSGQRSHALEGAKYIARLQEVYGDYMTIMPGCGVNAGNLEELYRLTKCTHYHLSGKTQVESQMTYRECMCKMNVPSSEFILEQASYEKIKLAKDVIDQLM